MKDNAKLMQVSLILMLVIPGGKYLSLPAVLSTQVGKDSWIVIAILLLVDAFCLFFMVMGLNKNKYSLTIDNILDSTIGKVPTKIIYLIFFVFLQLRIITLLSSMYKLFAATFTINATWLAFLLPISIFSIFIVAKGFRTLARLNQLLTVLILISLASILIYPAMQMDLSNLLPLFESDLPTLIEGTLNSSFWFTDYIFLYFVLGSIKSNKHPMGTVMGCFAVGALLTVVMNILFVALYGQLAPYTDLAMSKVSQFAMALTTTGRLDWLSLSVWTMSVFIKLALFVYSCYKCVQYFIGDKSIGVNYWVCIFVLAFSIIPMFLSADELLTLILPYAMYAFMLVQYILPLFLPLLVAIANKKYQKHMFVSMDSGDDEPDDLVEENDKQSDNSAKLPTNEVIHND